MKIKLSKWQTTVWDDKHRYIVVNCGRRSGKSTLVALRMTEYACKHPKSEIWYVAPDYKQAKQIMWLMLADIVPHSAVIKRNETSLIVLFRNGSRILLKGAADPDSLRGVRIDFCVFDECAFIDKWETAWRVIRPTLIDSRADVWFISTPNGFNHFKELAEKKDKDWAYHKYTSYDNPYLDSAELAQAKVDMDEDSFAQEIMGEFRKMAGLIYKEFDCNIHMVDIPDLAHNYTFTRSLDFGFGHKSALIYFAINANGTEIYAYDGIYQSGMVESDIAEAVKIKDAGRIIVNPVADSAQKMSINQLTKMGCHFNSVEKGPDSVKHGIVRVAELLKVRNDTGKPTLMFNKSLDWIADEFERYRWIENKSMDNAIKEVPLKHDDDAMDAIRYFAMSYMKPEKVIPHYDIKKWKW